MPQLTKTARDNEQVFRGKNLHPILHQVADEAPDETVRVIVQKSGLGEDAEATIRANGGSILHKYTIIDAFLAELPASNALKLSGDPAIRWVSLDAPVDKSAGPPQETGKQFVYDSFQTAAYGGSDGTNTWSEPWSEIGETDGSNLGNVVVTRFFGGEQQGLRLQGSIYGAQRFLNLANTVDATLSFSYRRKGLADAGHYVSVEASKNDGQTWTEIGRIAGPATDNVIATASFDISGFSSSSTGIRFLSSATMGTEHRVYIDNVQIEFQPRSADEVLYNEYTLYLPQIMSGGNGIPQQAQVADREVATDVPLLVTNRRVAVDTRPQAIDNFNARSYKGDNGSVDWASKWQEFGETQNEYYGLIKVVSSRRCTSGYCLRMGTLLSSDYAVDAYSIVREVDLSRAAKAELSFDYRRRAQGYGSTSVNVEISTDNGRSWSLLEEYKLNRDDDYTQKALFDISNYISYQTLIRFRLSGTIPRYTTTFLYIDDVKVAYEEGNNPQNPNDDEVTQLPTNGSVRDTFTFDGYGNNDGTIEWLDRWTEINDEGSPDRGDIWVWQYELSMRNNNRGVERTFNFAGSGEATLSFDYQRYSFDSKDDYVTVALSSDDGNTWSEIYRLQGPATDRRYVNQKIDISSYVSQETKIRFLTSPTLSQRDYLYLDNISISYNCEHCIDTSGLASKHVKTLDAHKLWNSSKSLQGQGMTVAVVDSGIANHPDLQDQNGESRVLAHVDFTGTTSGISDDYYGHGTHVAGLIAGNGNLSNGAYMGIAPKANLVDVRVINDFGSGYMSDVVAGLEWILINKSKYNIRVANLSLNSSIAESYHISPLNAALEILWFNKITVVVSAGNNGSDGILYPPANDPFVITVGATDTKGTTTIEDDEIASFSAQGKTQEGNIKPELVVPGKELTGLLASDDSNLVLAHPSHIVPGVNGNNYFNMSGTSMASAVASGAVLQLIQDDPTLTPDQIKHRLIETAKVRDGNNYLRIVQAVNDKSTESANMGTKVSRLLFTGPNLLDLDNQSWSSVAWGSVAWGSVAWGSIAWGSVAWGSVDWDIDNLEASDEIVDTDGLQ